MQSGPLSRYTILDFTQILAGPYATQMLADSGANVVKVEPPGGEFSRIRGPKRTTETGETISSYCAGVNRNKRSICIDLKSTEGLALAHRLAARADVVVENFAPGTLARLGLNFAELRERMPALITCSVSLYGGFESAGELARRGGLAMVAEAVSSFTSMQRHYDGMPVAMKTPVGDMSAGLAAYGAIVTALLEREHTGIGQHLDISMVKAMLSINSIAITGEEITARQQIAAHEISYAGMGVYRSLDGYVSIAVNTDSLFHRLARALGLDWMIEDPRYATYQERDSRGDEVNAAITAWTTTHTVAEALETISPTGVPIGQVATPRDVLDSDEIAGLGLLESVDDGLGEIVRSPTSSIGFRQNAPAIPRTGQHSEELLAELLGVDPGEYEKLRAAGAFGAGR